MGRLRTRRQLFSQWLQNVQGRLVLVRGQQVRNRLGRLPIGQPGLTGSPLGFAHGLGTPSLKAPEEKLTEEGVVAIPLAPAAERLQKKPTTV